MISRSRIALGVGVVVLLIAAGFGVSKVMGPKASTNSGGHPNVLIIMTDDQTLESMRVMTNANKLIKDQGSSYERYYTSFPNCCPSRATYLTGQFSHNNGVRDNVAPYGGIHNLKADETLPVWMQRAGYYTAHVGKYLNGYGANGNLEAPKGWTRWMGLIDPTTYNYYNFSVSIDGTRKDYGQTPEDYSTDVLGGEIVRIIEDRAESGQPWFVSWAPLAPHAQDGEFPSGVPSTNEEGISRTFPTPAERHKGKMANEKLPRSPSFNQKDVSKMPKFIQDRLPIQPEGEEKVQKEYVLELEALLAVDEWVGNIYSTLEKTGQLDNTVVLFTSDNGFYHGEHRLTYFKVFLYEEGVHLPLYIRGPGFPKGALVKGVAGNVDLAPTIMKIGGATSPLVLDGRDLAVIANEPAKGNGRGMLLENLTKSGSSHTEGIHTDRFVYLTNEREEEELYDLENDPYQMRNVADDPNMVSLKAALKERTEKAKVCKGATCEGATGKGD